MSDHDSHGDRGDLTAGQDPSGYSAWDEISGYLFGLVLATGLTVASFAMVHTNLIWGPGIAVALAVLAVAQIGVHLVFFLHLTTAPDNTNNVLALAFGVLIVAMIIGGSLWIMSHLNDRMMPMDQIMQMQR
jgi:cytochrome o ubiquinol oxidase operon protein cyoD